jgi:stage V sporulation protein D (sporulation-specific penicillin-binding protein)
MIVLMICLFCFGFIPVGANLFRLQVLQYEYYQQRAVKQQTSDKLITPKRGTIYDRNLKPLAESATVETVYLSPLDIKKNKEDPQLIADELGRILDIDPEKILKQTQRTNSQYEIVKSKVEKPQADLIRQFITENDIHSINFAEGSKRYYPYGNFAAHILGFVGTDNQGLAGVEALYDDELKGMAGRIITERTPVGEMPYKHEKYVDAQDGLGVVLTIDEVMQHFLEKRLEDAKIEYQLGQKATGIIMNVKTGEILAMAMKNDFDPNEPFSITDEEILKLIEEAPDDQKAAIRKEYLEGTLWRNNAISDSYEPGSVFKIFTAAMALEEKVVTPETQFHCGGSMQVGKWKIDCWKTIGHGAETFVEGLENSCNVVFMSVAEKMGRNIFYKYQTAFGFRDKTGIDLPGEGISLLHSLEDLNAAELATSAFGQTFKVTPIQVITAVSAVANGGTLYEPYVVKELIDSNNTVVKSFAPEAKRQVISEETSAIMRSALESVVVRGTGKNAYIAGFNLAGKTGTSEKVDVKDASGATDRTKRIASFCAFAPAYDPQIACLVILDEPKDYKQGGGAIAAPTVRLIMEDCLKYLGVEPQYTEDELKRLDLNTPDTTGRTADEARKIVKEASMIPEVIGEGDTVIRQLPKEGTKMPANTKVLLITEENIINTAVTVPNVVGMTPEEANRAITDLRLNVRISGANTTGKVTVVEQTPRAGASANIGDVVTIEFKDMVDIGE